jgi:mannose-1-phosphate guanylyltransferase
MNYAVVMAGGSGTRFWPKSTRALPKQFLNLFGERTMLQQTVDRLEGFINEEQVMVITNQNYVPIVKDQLPKANPEWIVGEPVARNTAPCVAAAAALLHREDPDSVMVVLPADHRIGKPDRFRDVLETAVDIARREESLVTVGIKPNRPETGYGYIRFDSASAPDASEKPYYRVQNFTEKPDAATAESFLNSGDYLWNSGMFIWKTEVIIRAFKQYMPEVFKLMEKLMASGGSEEDLNQFYQACPSISIDYGIMEKAETVHVVPGDVDWSDVGSWTTVHELSDKDENGNATGKAAVSLQNASSNLVHTESEKLVALVGVDNLAVVETDSAILVVNLDQSQDVKKVVQELKEDPSKEKFL